MVEKVKFENESKTFAEILLEEKKNYSDRSSVLWLETV